MATNYGKNINISIYGGSHDPEIGIIARGLPAGFAPDMDELSAFMRSGAEFPLNAA